MNYHKVAEFLFMLHTCLLTILSGPLQNSYLTMVHGETLSDVEMPQYKSVNTAVHSFSIEFDIAMHSCSLHKHVAKAILLSQ